MSDTPRLRSAFPSTPQKDYSRSPSRPVSRTVPPPKTLSKKPSADQDGDSSLLPTRIVDPPTQRLYVAAVYVALNTWRLYEACTASDDLDSTWLFLKWASIDGIFLFGLQALRIPWLEWAFPTTLALFLVHVVFNIFLMFRIPIPFGAWLSGMIKLAYDRELSISGQSIKPGDVINNASLILGKQIVNILPEGSAVLNPHMAPLCLDSQQTTVDLPIRVNQTDPILIELLRLDFNNGDSEIMSIPAKQLKQLKRQAEKRHSQSSFDLHRDLFLPIRKPGLYRLRRVVDESKLEVRVRSSDSIITACPRALIKNSYSHKCRGELSNLVLAVEGTPPLKIKYSRQVNDHDRGFSFQNIQPDHLRTPLLGHRSLGRLFDAREPEITWAQSQVIEIPLNESLNIGGDWLYMVEEVHDGTGNVANYSMVLEESDRLSSNSLSQWHQFSVHEIPKLSLSGCNDQQFLEVARGENLPLPVRFHKTDHDYANDGPFSLIYSYGVVGQESMDDPARTVRQLSLKTIDQKPMIKDQGWYSMKYVSSQFCSGEIFEPSSCYLHNPPEPELTVRSEKIFDKCANSPVGLLVDLDLTGSPSFRLRYAIESPKGVETKHHIVDGLRSQLDFTPLEAGHYRYRFLDISDSVYAPRPLENKVPVLEQDVKPPASAHFIGTNEIRKACFGEPISVDVAFLGEAPWTLQYELVHNGKKTRHVLESETTRSTIVTDKLVSGGSYNLVLTSVKDRSNCKRNLNEILKIDARSKPPHVSFGQIDKSRKHSALQDTKIDIPVRLSGERPWTLQYKNLDADSTIATKTFWQENSFLTVSRDGRYELMGVTDSSCPGSVDEAAKVFEITWIPRPEITAVDDTPVGPDGLVSKNDVCQSQGDSLELRLTGNPPYTIQCEQRRKVPRGSTSARVRSLKTALNALTMELETSEPGDYTYRFKEVGDNLYHNDPTGNQVVVTQRVNPLPTARFDAPGRIYGFCKEDDSGEELIPLTMEGVPPFSLEISIKHYAKAKPEIVSIPNIKSNRHSLPIPRRHLDLGQHVVSIHKVRDARGCEKSYHTDLSSVRVAVSDVPTIVPLESKSDYCVGERLSFSLSGHSPFDVFYTFNGIARKASSQTNQFRRIAEKPGIFTITAVSDGASGRCKAHKDIVKTIHQMPSVKISNGQVSIVDIHEGGEAELEFEFWGTPPFEFTYAIPTCLSSLEEKGRTNSSCRYIRSTNARKGKKPEILDIKHDVSYEHQKIIKTSDEGTYEVVAIKDKFCSFSAQPSMERNEKLLTS